MNTKKNAAGSGHEEVTKKFDTNRVIRLNDLNEKFTTYFDQLGSGYLRVTTPGVEIAVQQSGLSPLLHDGMNLSWPEAGVVISTESLEHIYTRQLSCGMILLECDFKKTQIGLSFLFQPESETPLFELIMELNEAETLTLTTLEKRRSERNHVTPICDCCKNRARRIKDSLREHPLYQILKKLQLKGIEIEVKINHEHTHVLSVWKIDHLDYDDGCVLLARRNDILTIDVSQIYAIQVYQEISQGVERSILSCYHSCKGEMIELSVIGKPYASDWERILEINQSIYTPASSRV